jgi:hypothetical protein
MDLPEYRHGLLLKTAARALHTNGGLEIICLLSSHDEFCFDEGLDDSSAHPSE